MSEESERVVHDELILSFRVPKWIPDPEAESARSILASPWFLGSIARLSSSADRSPAPAWLSSPPPSNLCRSPLRSLFPDE